jgi:hypothetical protein
MAESLTQEITCGPGRGSLAAEPSPTHNTKSPRPFFPASRRYRYRPMSLWYSIRACRQHTANRTATSVGRLPSPAGLAKNLPLAACHAVRFLRASGRRRHKSIAPFQGCIRVGEHVRLISSLAKVTTNPEMRQRPSRAQSLQSLVALSRSIVAPSTASVQSDADGFAVVSSAHAVRRCESCSAEQSMELATMDWILIPSRGDRRHAGRNICLVLDPIRHEFIKIQPVPLGCICRSGTAQARPSSDWLEAA